HGVELGGRRVGTFGDAAAFSFYPTKNLGALGDAGAVVTSDPGLAERARRLREYGWGEDRVSLERAGQSRLDTLQAALLLAKLPLLERWNERRRALADRYTAAFADSTVEPPAQGEHVYHLYVVRSAERDALRRRLRARGVETLVHYPRAVSGARRCSTGAAAPAIPTCSRGRCSPRPSSTTTRATCPCWRPSGGSSCRRRSSTTTTPASSGATTSCWRATRSSTRRTWRRCSRASPPRRG